MWDASSGHTYFHALTKYRIAQLQLGGMTAEQFDALRVFVARPGELPAHDSGMTLGQLMRQHRDADDFEVIHPATGLRHAVRDVDKQLEEGRITFTVDAKASP